MEGSIMLSIAPIINRLDKYQRKHKSISFVYAVIKKYGEDNGGYQSALITYYAMLSLFPLLVVITSLAKLIFNGNSSLRQQISHSVTRYIPVIGDQIQYRIHDPGKTGLILVVTILITLYGARGVAGAMQFSLSSVWRVPPAKRPPFIKNLTRSMGIIAAGGAGLILTSVLSGFSVHVGNYAILKVLSSLLSFIIIWVTLIYVFKMSIAGNKKFSDLWRGAAVAAIAIEILQLLGNIILAHQLRSLNTSYGVFALAIGLMFWIYLQAEVIVYGSEVDAVRHFRLYPRGITEPSPADKTKES